MSKFRIATEGSPLRRLVAPAVLTAVLFTVAVAGSIVSHQQNGVAAQAHATTESALRANASALDVLIKADAGVRSYVHSGDVHSLDAFRSAQANLRQASAALDRLLPQGSADQAFAQQTAAYLRTMGVGLVAMRMAPVPPAAVQIALNSADQRVTELLDQYSQAHADRIVAGQDAVSAAQASARTASIVANGSGSAGAILLLAMFVVAKRRTAAQRLREVTTASSALDALSVSVPSSNAYADSQEHDDRVGRIAERIAAAMGLPAVTQELLRQAAPLHDVGNVAVPDHILLKPGELTTDERAVMEQHTTTGAEILADSESAVLRMAQTISREHHERWDGLGYPQGLAGTEIHLSARIVAVADVFDALTHVRPHRQGATIKEALAYIVEERGAQFDPKVVDAFLTIDHRAIDAPAEAAASKQQSSQDAHALAL